MKARMTSIFVVMLLSIPLIGASYAGNPCQPVERDLAYGSAALEDAKDSTGFLQSAKEFEAAVKKAPNCAAAHFNLGLVYEKAHKYEEAMGALQTYLRLSPNARDVSEVKTKIYKLEYRIKQNEQNEVTKRNELAKYSGTWRNYLHTVSLEVSSFGCRVSSSGVGESNKTNEVRKASDCEIKGDRLQIKMRGSGGGAYPFSYSVLCGYSLNEDGNRMKGEFLSGSGSGRFKTICTTYDFKKIN